MIHSKKDSISHFKDEKSRLAKIPTFKVYANFSEDNVFIYIYNNTLTATDEALLLSWNAAKHIDPVAGTILIPYVRKLWVPLQDKGSSL